MIQCVYCPRVFAGNADGRVEKTFHELLHGPEIVNQ